MILLKTSLLAILVVLVLTGMIAAAYNPVIYIPSIDLQSPVVPVSMTTWVVDGVTYGQYRVDDNYVGWHDTSAPIGQVGNTVLNGHSDIHGAVLKNLRNVKIGDKIELYNGNTHIYTITDIIIVKEKGVSTAQRLENAKYVYPTDDRRVTIVTCIGDNAEYRLIVIAR